MKALDTPALLAILEGRREARWILDELEGEEVCTTEINLFELQASVLADKRSERTRRMLALDRLRRRISIFPLDEKSTRAAAHLWAERKAVSVPLGALILGTLEAYGATELLTTEAGRFQMAGSPVPIRLLRSRPPKRTKSRN